MNKKAKCSIENGECLVPLAPRLTPHACSALVFPNRRLPGFTLVELVVVVAIIAILVAVVVPGATSMWEQRKRADAETLIRGVLMTSRAAAVRETGVESGVLFYLDADGVQRMVAIEQDPHCLACPAEDPLPSGDIPELEVCANVFRVTGERAHQLSRPIRVVPRHVVENDKPGPADDFVTFSPDELANNDLMNLPIGSNKNQRHRNYFTLVYSGAGQLIVGRNVLIRDDHLGGPATSGLPPGRGRGGVTEIEIGHDIAQGCRKGAKVKEYWGADDLKKSLDPRPGFGAGGPATVPYLVADAGDIAINFPSVDGLLVYDDSLFESFTDPKDKRTALLESAQPFYVNRLTGAVVQGPAGENQ